MTPYYDRPEGQIYYGHTLTVLPELKPKSVHMIVTSPPYWGLRDYGIEPQVWDDPGDCPGHVWGDESFISNTAPRDHDGSNGFADTRGTEPSRSGTTLNASQGQFCQHCNAWRGSLGLEPTPELFVQHIVQIFHELKRVLRDDGTLWLNFGDSYSSTGRSSRKESPGVGAKQEMDAPGRDIVWKAGGGSNFSWALPGGQKPKDLVGVPWMVAFALRADGWYLRQDIIWSKGNPMPESVKDRCCKSHEYMFLLTKSARYYFDHIAIQEDTIGNRSKDMGQKISTDGQGESGGQEVLLFGERAINEESVSKDIRANRRTEREISNCREDARTGREIQDSDQAILAESEGKGPKGEKRQGVFGNREGEVLKTKDRNKTETSNKDTGLHLDTGSMEGNKKRAQTSLRVLPEEDGAPGNGSCDSSFKRRAPHEREHSSGVSELQRKKGSKTINGNIPGRDDGGRACNDKEQTKRNKRSVWNINTHSFPEAHFATFPPKLIEPCILAGTSEKGCCPECGAPWERVVDRTTASPGQKPGYTRDCTMRNDGERAGSFTDMSAKTTGWNPTCSHTGSPIPCTVMDPFFGSGTVGIVSYKHGRKFKAIDLSKTYLDDIAIPRIERETSQQRLPGGF